MNDHAGRIDHRTEVGSDLAVDFVLKQGEKRFDREQGFNRLQGPFFFQELLSEPSQSFSDGVHNDRSWMKAEKMDDLGCCKHLVDTGYSTKNLLMMGWRHWAFSSSGVFSGF